MTDAYEFIVVHILHFHLGRLVSHHFLIDYFDFLVQ